MDITPHPALDDVQRLLARCGLPGDDLTAANMPDFVIARDGDRILGVAGFQLFGACALVRSVAVDPDRRRRGVGDRLLAAVERQAAARGADRFFLLTHDAQAFFARHGYVEMSRSAAPDEIRGSGQFGSSCCGAATLMTRDAEG